MQFFFVFNIWCYFHFLDVLAADRKPPGVGRGRGRGRDDTSGRPAKGIGRGQDDGSSKGGGRGRGGAGGKGGGVRGNHSLISSMHLIVIWMMKPNRPFLCPFNSYMDDEPNLPFSWS